MGGQSDAYLVLAAGGVPGLGELYLLLLLLGMAAAVIPTVGCYYGERGRTAIVWRPVIYVLAVLVGAPAGVAGGYASKMGFHSGLGSSLLTEILDWLPGIFIGAGLLPFGIARLLTRPKAGRDATAGDW